LSLDELTVLNSSLVGAAGEVVAEAASLPAPDPEALH
jgi:hypothetical protein